MLHLWRTVELAFVMRLLSRVMHGVEGIFNLAPTHLV